MPHDDIHQPHDKLFKIGFSDPVNAAGFLQAELPADLAEMVDWTKLALQPGTFVDSHYRTSQSDLLFSAPVAGQKGFFYILFEHQTTPEAFLPLRLHRYKSRIWEAHLTANPEATKLPVILPVVLAQNSQVWAMDPQFSAMLAIPHAAEEALRPFIPDFTYILRQLAEIPFESIRGTPAGILILRTMKAERMSMLLSDPVWDESLLVQLPQDIFELLVRYMLDADIDKPAFESKIKTIKDTTARTNAMTLAQQYRAEGHTEGHHLGVIRSTQQHVVETLEIRFSAVPEGLRDAVFAISDEAKLRLLFQSAVRCVSLEAFASGL